MKTSIPAGRQADVMGDTRLPFPPLSEFKKRDGDQPIHISRTKKTEAGIVVMNWDGRPKQELVYIGFVRPPYFFKQIQSQPHTYHNIPGIGVDIAALAAAQHFGAKAVVARIRDLKKLYLAAIPLFRRHGIYLHHDDYEPQYLLPFSYWREQVVEQKQGMLWEDEGDI